MEKSNLLIITVLLIELYLTPILTKNIQTVKFDQEPSSESVAINPRQKRETESFAELWQEQNSGVEQMIKDTEESGPSKRTRRGLDTIINTIRTFISDSFSSLLQRIISIIAPKPSLWEKASQLQSQSQTPLDEINFAPALGNSQPSFQQKTEVKPQQNQASVLKQPSSDTKVQDLSETPTPKPNTNSDPMHIVLLQQSSVSETKPKPGPGANNPQDATKNQGSSQQQNSDTEQTNTQTEAPKISTV